MFSNTSLPSVHNAPSTNGVTKTLQTAAALLLVVMAHVLPLWYWWQHPTQPRQQSSAFLAPVLQAVLLPSSADGSTDESATDTPAETPVAQPLSEAALARAKITDTMPAEAASQAHQHGRRAQQRAAGIGNAVAKQQSTVQADIRHEPAFVNDSDIASDAGIKAAIETAEAIDPMAMPGVEETPHDANNVGGNTGDREDDDDSDGSGNAQETLLLPDMREMAQGTHEQTNGQISGQTSQTGNQSITDEDWLRTPATPPVRTVTQQEYANNPPPIYPALSQRLQEEGTVWLRAVVGVQGAVVSLRVRQSSGFGMLDNAAVTAVRRWRLEPGTQNGVPTQTEVDIPVVFQLLPKS